MKNSIFISYRRDGSSWSTRTLHVKLCEHFGSDNVFIDIDDIDYGTNFVEKIEKEIGRCNVVLVVISPQWLSISDEEGRKRLDNPDDYVRLEIGMGLKRRIPVVPILVDGASMPKESELPDNLKPLSQHNAVELRHSHFDSDIKLLINSLQKTLKSEYPETVPLNEKKSLLQSIVSRIGIVRSLGAAAIVALTVIIIIWWMGSSDKNVITAKNGSVAAGGDVNVHRDLIINNELDPKILELVTSTVNTLTSQLEVKDQQLQLREEQTKQLSDAVAALAMEKDKPDAPPGLDQALTNLEQGDTESAKAIFQQLLDKKSAEAKIASQEAAAAAQHLGALALLDNQQEAVTAFERAIELDPENTEAQNQLGYIQKQPGEMRLQAVLSEAGKPIQTCFYIYYSEQDLDGNRKRLTYQCTTTANFTLEAGNYFIVATEDGGQASINQEFELKPGELINQVLTMQKN